MSRLAAAGILRSEGALLPPSFLARLAARDSSLPGLTPASYHLQPGERLAEAGSRAWNRLLELWEGFHTAADRLAPGDWGTTLTRERWLLPLFSELGYGRLSAARALELDGKSYPVSHQWQGVPIHLVGCNVPLDTRTPGVAGAARTRPHSLVQELLNRSDAHLWGVVSNGLKLRLLRDSRSLARQAFVEVDLEAVFAGGAYADFLLLFLLLHESRLEGPPRDCWLERWAKVARDASIRALDRLRDGVKRAIEALGEGFLAHPANGWLRGRLTSGDLSKEDLYRQLLRLAYRLIFLFAAEDRALLFPDGADATAKRRYLDHYSGRRLREIAGRQRGTPHSDLWRALRLVFGKLDGGCPELALPALGSFLWGPHATPDLDAAELANAHLLEAVRALAYTREGDLQRTVDWRNLGPEELGSVYESLLEHHPEIDATAGRFHLATAAGHDRKTTGSYYTPTSLIECLLDTALDPVVERAARERDPEAALLALKVCDPACGSGHFLLAAAHRIARRLAAVRSGDEEPPPDALRHALRDVIGRCVYGVDKNPMAVELCKVSLWLEALDPGRPLSFLDHHVQCGHSLLGTTPALLTRGIPEAAFDPIAGDDKDYARRWKAIHRRERKARGKGQAPLELRAPWESLGNLATAIHHLDELPDDTPHHLAEKEHRWEELVRSSDYLAGHLLADAWCAAFLWRKLESSALPQPITEDLFRRIERNPHSMPAVERAEVRRLAEEHRFFHWHLAFPDVFRPKPHPAEDDPLGWDGGFDCVLGNPPWERIKLQEKEFFAERHPDVANAPNKAARGRLIAVLEAAGDPLFTEFQTALRDAEGESALARSSGAFPLTGVGDINTYALFAERMKQVVSSTGRVGCILPLGIATDDTTKQFFRELVETRRLSSLYGFENEEKVFPGVHHALRFCLLTLAGAGAPVSNPAFAFSLRQVASLQDDQRRFTLTAEDIALINPNTLTCPIFRSRRDAEITQGIHRRVPVLAREEAGDDGNPWSVGFLRMFDMSNDSSRFRTRHELEADGWQLTGNVFHRDGESYLPLYEAKMVHHFDHRFGTYEGQTAAQSNQGKLPEATPSLHANPCWNALPRYWVAGEAVADRLAGRWDREWLLGWRDICRSTDERTLIASLIPRVAVGHKLLLFFSKHSTSIHCQLAVLSSFVFDYLARQKLGGTSFGYFTMKQLAFLPPGVFHEPSPYLAPCPSAWLRPRVLELTYTAWDLESFARDLGWDGPPFRWDEERRFLLRAELDAAFFHLYGVSRDDAAYILDTFPVVKKNDEKRFGTYRTRDTILDLYDRMSRAIETGEPYQTVLDPPPADPRIAHAGEPAPASPLRA